MRQSSQFAVPAPPERAFALLLDPAVMRSCVPGCEELARVDDTTFRGRLVNAIAHVRFNADFSVTMTSVEPPSRVVAVLKGEDHRLASSIRMDAVLSVMPDGAGSLVGYQMDMALWGKLGRLGESIVRKRTAEVQEQFLTAFYAACAGEPAAAGAGATGQPTEGEQAIKPPIAAPPPIRGGLARPGLWARFLGWLRRRRSGRNRAASA